MNLIVGVAAFLSYMAGPDGGYIGKCPDAQECAVLVDFDKDGDVDLRDWSHWQNRWVCNEAIEGYAYCGGRGP